MQKGIASHVIKRGSDADYDYGISYRQFIADMLRAGQAHHAVWTWSGALRDGTRVTVAWVAEWRSGRLLATYELPEGA